MTATNGSPYPMPISGDLIAKWQEMVNLLGELAGVPAALIMRIIDSEIEVLVADQTGTNPYKVGHKERLDGSGLYCERVIKTKNKLLVPDASSSEEWKSNPDVALNMISYLGFPILWPNGEPFGTICVLDTRSNNYSPILEKLIAHFRDSAESHLQDYLRNFLLETKNRELFDSIHLLEQSQKALSASEAKYRTLVDNIPDIVLTTDNDGNIQFVSGTAEALSGYTVEEILKQEIDILHRIHSDDIDRVMKAKEKTHRTGEPSPIEFRFQHKDGSWIWMNARASVVSEGTGAAAVYTILTDITDRKRAEELAIQTARLTSTADLSLGIAHNFNNLLQMIMGGADLAIMDLEEGKLNRVKAYLERVVELVQSGAAIVTGLQKFADTNTGTSQLEGTLIDVSSVVRQAANLMESLLNNPTKNSPPINMTFTLEENCIVAGSEKDLLDILVKLITNASESLVHGGSIEVGARKFADKVILTVRDTGIGISENDLPKIFQPFWTTKGMDIGKGLSLSAAHGLIKRMNGDIRVQSKPGSGTLFTISLPMVLKPDRQDESLHRSIGEKPLTIVVVDDDSDIANLIERICSSAGHNVFTCYSGAEALSIYEHHHVDVILSDLGMPEMNGWDLGKAIVADCTAKNRTKPVFMVLTGWTTQDLADHRIVESGVDKILTKPVSAQGLLAAIKDAVIFKMAAG